MKSTKELARQLGLLRRHSSTTQQSRDARKVKKTNQEFAYLVVIDFESTCWKEKRNGGQEIIEFPAVLLNTSTGSIESEFHTYVLPEENTQLSEFCTELTGITQDQVEAGIPLRLCLSKLSRWLKKQEDERNIVYNSGGEGKKLCTFVTWSDWDLSVCLHYECRRKQLLKPNALNSWIDLRATYKKFYERKPNGLHGALQDVGIEFLGRQHSGLDDARNTASLAWRMMCDGCLMKITRTMPGTQQLKRKQTTRPSDQPPKQQTKPNTSSNIQQRTKSNDLQRQEPDLPDDRCRVPGDSLVSYTQGICKEAVYSEMNLDSSASASHGFKIFEDAGQTASVHNVIKLKTSIPNVIRNNLGQKKNHQNTGRAEQVMPLISVRTSLEGLTVKDQVISGRAEPKPCSLNIRTNVNSVVNTSSTKVNMNSKRNGSNSKPMTKALCTDGPSVDHTQSTSVISKQNLKVGVKNLRSKTPCAKSTLTKCSNSVRATPQLNTASSFKSPSPSILKTPLNTPMQGARVPTPSGGFKTPYAPVPYPTPGSTTDRTPSLSNRGHCTPSGCKITPPMCQCGRRTKKHTVVSPGPNIDRVFYFCTLGRRSSEVGLLDVTNTKKGCRYFKWESMVLAEKRLSMSTTPENGLTVKRQGVGSLINTARFTSPQCTVRTTLGGSTGKRLGIAMRGVIHQQSRTNKTS